MTVTEQGEFGLKHIALLRKAIMEQRSGAIWCMGSDWSCIIPFDQGVLLGSEAPDMLARVLQEPVLRFEWKESYRPDEGINIPILPRQAISQAVAGLEMPVERMIAYRKVFANLPSVSVRYMSTFRFDAEHQKLYQTLYQMTLPTGSVALEDFFAQAPDITELRKRVTIVIAAYCMGDLLPAVAGAAAASASSPAVSVNSASATASKDTARVVSRIMARLLGGVTQQ